jgi:hypothetical protein
MIKKLLVVITLATVVIACGDKKKDNTEAQQFVCVGALVESADSLLALDEVTLVGKLGLCPVSKEDVVLAGKGVFVKVVPAEGIVVDTLLFCKAVLVTGKLSAEVLDSAAVAACEAKLAECKASCEKAKEECKGEAKEAETKSCCAKKEEDKGCCAKKEERKSCCSAPKAGDKVFTITVTKVEKFECAAKEEDHCAKKEEVEQPAETEEQVTE